MTDAVIFKNNASSRLGINVAAASITVTLEAGTGVRFPTPAAAQFFPLIVQDQRTGQFEIMYCTQRINDVLTVTRAQEGTTAQDWLLGASAWSTATAGVFTTYFDYSWSKSEADARFVNTAGDTMTGALTLPGDPTIALHATTKAWVEALVLTVTSITEAPADGSIYGRKDIGWALTNTRAEYLAVSAQVTANVADIVTLFATTLTDAPSNGNEYVRKNGAWSVPAAAISDAPSDSQYYTRRNLAWTAYTPAILLSQLLTVDGAGSGLDADLLDGVNGASFALLSGPTFTGVPSAPTAAALTNTTQLATTAFVTAAGNLKANLAGPTFTGVPAAPTAAAGTSTTQLATTAMAQAAIDAKAVRYDAVQALTAAQLSQAHTNIADNVNARQIAVNYSVVQADRGKLIYATAALTLTLPNPTLVSDFMIDWKNVGGVLSVTATAGPVIDNGVALTLPYAIPDLFEGSIWSDGTNWQLTKRPTGGQLFKRTVVTATNAAWAIDPTTKFLFVQVQGAGGSGGGNVSGTTGTCGSAGGGGGGGYADKYFAKPAAATANITIGAGGAVSATNGNNGSASSWADGTNTLTGGGGAGGTSTGAVTSLTNAYGGTGGTASGGAVNIPGAPGENSLSLGSSMAVTARVSLSGNGGVSTLGVGGLGAIATSSTGTAIFTSGGGGLGYGGGGGGGGAINTNGTGAGGAGSDGVVIVWEFR